MNLYASSIAMILLLAACAPRPETGSDSKALVGLCVSEAIKVAGLKPHLVEVIEEPPAVPRGIRGKDAKGDMVELYIKRGAVPMTIHRDWEIDAFLDQIVIFVREPN